MSISNLERSKLHYQANKELYKQRAKQNRIEMYQYVCEYLRDHPCDICGEDDIVVLEFHHLRDKTYTIAELIGKGAILKLKDEIKKCQVLCANCHKRVTAKERNYYKYDNVAQLVRASACQVEG